MMEGYIHVQYPRFGFPWYCIVLLCVCFTRVQQEELLKSLYRNMRYTQDDRQYIPAITLRRFLQLAEADDDPTYRRHLESRLDTNPDNYEQVNIFYSKQVRGQQMFNLSRRIGNISKIQRADLVIKDYGHSFRRVRVSPLTEPQTRRYRHWTIAKWTIEGYSLNVTRRIRNHLRKGHKTIRFRVCAENRGDYLRCRAFGKFSIALVIQLNVHMDVWHEFSTQYRDIIDKLSKRETYQIRTKRSENNVLTETPMQTTPVPIESPVEHAETNICHVHPWPVAFADIGWIYVISPLAFQANVCVGECPSPLASHSSLQPTYHSSIVDLYHTYHNMSENGIPPRPCCTATEMAPLSVYLMDDTLMRLEGMRITACGCR